jgi:hypothetical protein
MNVHFKPAVSTVPTLNMSRRGPAHTCTPKSTWIDMWQSPDIRFRSVTSRVQVIRGSKVRGSSIRFFIHPIYAGNNVSDMPYPETGLKEAPKQATKANKDWK